LAASGAATPAPKALAELAAQARRKAAEIRERIGKIVIGRRRESK
jgi:hypothetical protein